MAAHALLSASGATRWLNCPPSARLETQFLESAPSEFAQEGTLAHSFAELELRKSNKEITAAVYKREKKALENNKLFSSEMPGEVEKFTSYVIEEFNAAKKKSKDAVLLIEQRLDFSHVVEKGFGTGDVLIIADGVMQVIDLKYGKGVRVDAEKNAQLMLYGLGALNGFDLEYDINAVRLTIMQPRLDHISEWTISVEDLESWAEKTVKPTAQIAYAGKGVQKAGDHCRWCKAKAMCATLAAKNIELAKHEFRDPKLLTVEQLVEVFGQQPMLVDWVKAVGDYLLEQAKQGKTVPGYKLVEGRSNRKWVDEEKAKAYLSISHDEKEYLNTKIAGIGQIEKLVGKTHFTNNLSKFVEKPQGAPTLVPETDKRPALGGLNSAKNDFSEDV